jgi:DNA-binding MarR family transcriptional regulator
MKLRVSLFPRIESPGFLIYRAANRMKAGLHRAFADKGFKITAEQWSVLSSLWESEGIHQSSLARKTEKDRHTITRILTLLEKESLVTRGPDRADKRLQRVYLTKEGRSLQPQLVKIARSFAQQALAGLTEEDLDSMRRILGTIAKNLAASSEDPRGSNSKSKGK